MIQRKLADAGRYYRRAADLDESDFHSAMMLITVNHAAGDTEGVFNAARLMLERSERALASDPLNASALGVSAQALAILGEVDRAKERHVRAMLIDPDNVNMPYNFACMLTIRLHEDEAALDLIEPLFKRVSLGLIRTALSDPDMDRLLDHPRFVAAARAAIERTGLDPTSLPAVAREKLGV
jgi:adenylate cyclase